MCSHFVSRGTAHALLELVLPSMAPSKWPLLFAVLFRLSINSV